MSTPIVWAFLAFFFFSNADPCGDWCCPTMDNSARALTASTCNAMFGLNQCKYNPTTNGPDCYYYSNGQFGFATIGNTADCKSTMDFCGLTPTPTPTPEANTPTPTPTPTPVSPPVPNHCCADRNKLSQSRTKQSIVNFGIEYNLCGYPAMSCYYRLNDSVPLNSNNANCPSAMITSCPTPICTCATTDLANHNLAITRTYTADLWYCAYSPNGGPNCLYGIYNNAYVAGGSGNQTQCPAVVSCSSPTPSPTPAPISPPRGTCCSWWDKFGNVLVNTASILLRGRPYIVCDYPTTSCFYYVDTGNLANETVTGTCYEYLVFCSPTPTPTPVPP